MANGEALYWEDGKLFARQMTYNSGLPVEEEPGEPRGVGSLAIVDGALVATGIDRTRPEP